MAIDGSRWPVILAQLRAHYQAQPNEAPCNHTGTERAPSMIHALPWSASVILLCSREGIAAWLFRRSRLNTLAHSLAHSLAPNRSIFFDSSAGYTKVIRRCVSSIAFGQQSLGEHGLHWGSIKRPASSLTHATSENKRLRSPRDAEEALHY